MLLAGSNPRCNKPNPAACPRTTNSSPSPHRTAAPRSSEQLALEAVSRDSSRESSSGGLANPAAPRASTFGRLHSMADRRCSSGVDIHRASRHTQHAPRPQAWCDHRTPLEQTLETADCGAEVSNLAVKGSTACLKPPCSPVCLLSPNRCMLMICSLGYTGSVEPA